MKHLSDLRVFTKSIKEEVENEENKVIAIKDTKPQNPIAARAVPFLEKIAR